MCYVPGGMGSNPYVNQVREGAVEQPQDSGEVLLPMVSRSWEGLWGRMYFVQRFSAGMFNEIVEEDAKSEIVVLDSDGLVEHLDEAPAQHEVTRLSWG